jgi:hypothetical protein
MVCSQQQPFKASKKKLRSGRQTSQLDWQTIKKLILSSVKNAELNERKRECPFKFLDLGGSVLERDYQAKLIKRIEKRFPNAVVLKNDPSYRQGIPDLIILQGPYFALLEVKTSPNFVVEPNQRFYISHFNLEGFASFIWPEVEEDVLDAVQQSFESRR